MRTILCLVALLAGSHAVKAATLTQFTPTGWIKKVQQVKAVFSDPMVAFGDPKVQHPFTANCPVVGSGRWTDLQTWVYTFSDNLPGDSVCTFKPHKNLKTLKGVSVHGLKKSYTFHTGGPSVLESTPTDGNHGIAEDQIFILRLDASATESSLLNQVYFTQIGIYERIGIRLIKGSQRKSILDTLSYLKDEEKAASILIQARQTFQAKKQVRLVWGKDVQGQKGGKNPDAQILTYRVRESFSARIDCSRINPRAGCAPDSGVSLSFTSAIPVQSAKKIALINPDTGETWHPKISKNQKWLWSAYFPPPFKPLTHLTLHIPKNLKDDAGRTLVNKDTFPRTIQISDFAPQIKFSGAYGIFERLADPAIPVTLRNTEPDISGNLFTLGHPKKNVTRTKSFIKSFLHWRKKVHGYSEKSSLFSKTNKPVLGYGTLKPLTLPKPATKKTHHQIGVPVPKSGVYVLELQSRTLEPDQKQSHLATMALVTNLATHVKWGHANTLVWVTTLDSGTPVSNAQVSIFDCDGKLLAVRQTNKSGIVTVGTLPPKEKLPRCDFGFYGSEIMVVAQTPSDISVVGSGSNEGIEPWRYQISTYVPDTPVIAHTIFARSLLRAGETVHMKHVVRKHKLTHFNFLPKSLKPNRVEIQHVGSNETTSFPIKWSPYGSSETTWTIPKTAKLGTYQVTLVRKSTKKKKETLHRFSSGRFRVEAFKVPLMKSTLTTSQKPLISPKKVPVDIAVHYLSGGAASKLSTTLMSQLAPKSETVFEEHEKFIFANGAIKAGVVEEDQDPLPPFAKKKVTLDEQGTAKTVFKIKPELIQPHVLHIELSFKDPNGEIQTSSKRQTLWAAEWLAGLKVETWTKSGKPTEVPIRIVDASGKSIAKASVRLTLFERITHSHRKRLVGGFYAYENTTEYKKHGTQCSGRTDDKGELRCAVTVPFSGQALFQVEAKDPKGKRVVAHHDTWVSGEDPSWFAQDNHDRMDLIPEKKTYEPGESAKIQVRMPFKQATALITVERDGVLDFYTQPLNNTSPIVTVPIKPSYAPNIYASVMVVRGRIQNTQPLGKLDLGKPAYKLGLTSLKVGWKKHTLDVQVTADKPTYKVREKVTATIHVSTPDKKPAQPNGEVLLAVVDEGLLRLMKNDSWDILKAMMYERGLGVRTATSQSHVVGKRHFGLKAHADGGGGGSATGLSQGAARTLFNTLVFWKTRIKLNKNGKATVSFPLNDSLTQFRIVAIAFFDTHLFGSGETHIQSTQDLLSFSGLPTVARFGDIIYAPLTLKNTTDDPQNLSISLSVNTKAHPDKTEILKPQASATLYWPITINTHQGVNRYEFKVNSNGKQVDRLIATQRITPTVSDRVIQSMLFQLDKPKQLPISKPKSALPDRGSVQLKAFSKLEAPSVKKVMARYPFTCFEQKLSKAISLQDKPLFKELSTNITHYLDDSGLVKFFSSMNQGSVVLTAYTLSVTHGMGWRFSKEAHQKMIQGLRTWLKGGSQESLAYSAADKQLKILMVLVALSNHKNATVHDTSRLRITPALWPTSALIDWLVLLHRLPFSSETKQSHLKTLIPILSSRLVIHGSTIDVNEIPNFWWLLVSPNTQVAKLILALLETQTLSQHIPKLTQRFIQSQKRGSWDGTVANAWGTLALNQFNKKYQAKKITGATHIKPKSGDLVRFNWNAKSTHKNTTLPFSPLSLMHKGQGAPWISLISEAAVPLTHPVDQGYRIKKTWEPVHVRTKGAVHIGDIFRIRLKITAAAGRTWVVVEDSIPSGATILGSGLGNDSELSTQASATSWPTYEERTHSFYRAYYEYRPKGAWETSYQLRINHKGSFNLSSTRVEAMYDPDLYGEYPNDTVVVR